MSNEIETPKKPSFLWGLVKMIFLVFFPGIRLLKINSRLKRVSKFYKHEWFDKQRKRNLLVSLGVSLPLILTSILSSLLLLKDESLWKTLSFAQSQLFSFEISKAMTLFSKAINNPDTVGRIEWVMNLSGFGILLSFLLGTIVLSFHPLIQDTKKLYSLLQKNGIIEKGNLNHLVLATPLGFLIDVTGYTAKEIKDTQRIWQSLNQRVVDWAEEPANISVCFFKKAYSLKPKYEYSFKTK